MDNLSPGKTPQSAMSRVVRLVPERCIPRITSGDSNWIFSLVFSVVLLIISLTPQEYINWFARATN